MKIITLKFPKDDEIQQRILIETAEDLLEYFEKVKSTRMAGAFESVFQGNQDDVINESFVRKENSESYTLALHYKHSGKDLISTSNDLQYKIFNGMLKNLNRDKKLIINHAGGYCFLDDDFVVLKVEEQSYAPVEFLTTKVF